MTAKSKQYRAAGWVGDEFRLSARERTRLARLGFSNEDFAWIEDQITMFNIRAAQVTSEPTPAQIRAGLEKGAETASNFLHWLVDLDSLSRERLALAALRFQPPPKRDFEWIEDIRQLLNVIEVARRGTGEPSAGNTKKSFKGELASLMAKQFGQSLAYEVLRNVLTDDTPDYLKRLIAGRNRSRR